MQKIELLAVPGLPLVKAGDGQQLDSLHQPNFLRIRGAT